MWQSSLLRLTFVNQIQTVIKEHPYLLLADSIRKVNLPHVIEMYIQNISFSETVVVEFQNHVSNSVVSSPHSGVSFDKNIGYFLTISRQLG